MSELLRDIAIGTASGSLVMGFLATTHIQPIMGGAVAGLVLAFALTAIANGLNRRAHR